MIRLSFDLNGDVGEGMSQDAELIPLLTSVNIACGGHAGDDETMTRAVQCAKAAGVAIGAHPSFPDREHFGRREIPATEEQIREWLLEQISDLHAVVTHAGATLHHIKPHGALYNVGARDARVAEAIAVAVKAIDPSLMLFALAGSKLAQAGQHAGLKVVPEGFCDRAYLANGTLAPRVQPGAVIEEEDKVLRQALALARGEPLDALDGGTVCPRVETLCLHGDGANAVVFAKRLRAEFASAGMDLKAPNKR